MKCRSYALLVSVTGLFLFCDQVENPISSEVVLNYQVPKGNYSVSSFFSTINGDTVLTMRPRCSYEYSKFVKKSDNEKFRFKLENELLKISSVDSTILGITTKTKKSITINCTKSDALPNSTIGLWGFKSISYANDSDSIVISEKIKSLKWIEFTKNEMYCYYETKTSFADEFQLYFNEKGYCENIELEKVSPDTLRIVSKSSSDSIYIFKSSTGVVMTTSNNKTNYTDYLFSELSLNCPNDKYPSWLDNEFKSNNCK